MVDLVCASKSLLAKISAADDSKRALISQMMEAVKPKWMTRVE